MARSAPGDDDRRMSEDSTSTPPPPGPSGPSTEASVPPHDRQHDRQPPRDRHRRLTRSTSDRVLGGVAGGLAHAFGIDPILLRLGFIVSCVLGGAGVIAYGVLWVVLPPDDGTAPIVHSRRHDPALWGGLALLVFGVLAVFDRISPWGHNDSWDFFWPLVLIGGGLAILVMRANETAVATAHPTPPPGAPSAETAVDAADETAETAVGPDAPTAEPPATAWAPPAPWPIGPPRPPQPTAPVRKRREPRMLGPITLSALLVFVGVAALLGTTGAMTVDPAVVASITLIGVGGALVVGAFYGRARGLIALGVLLTLVAGALATIDVPVRGGIGERDYLPTTVAGVRHTYRQGIGQLRVDLSRVDWTRDRDVDVRVGIGEATIVVPKSVNVFVEAHAGMGAVDIAGHHDNGVDADARVRLHADHRGAPIVHLDAEVGIGHVAVRRVEGALR
jgi:phage shock protein PspC (stress-responsive transcriptional regulator)